MLPTRTAVATVALLLACAVAGGAVGTAPTGERPAATSGAQFATSSTVNLTYKITQDNPVGKTVKLKSSTENGNNPPANWTVTAPNGTVVVNATETSTVQFTPQEPGNHTVSIHAEDSSTNYDGETSTISIERQVRVLHISNVNRSTPFHVTDTVEFTVKDNTSSYVENATVTVGNQTAVTDEDGAATVTFTDNGTTTLTVTKNATDTARYVPVNETYDVRYFTQKLVIGNTNTTPQYVGDTVEFTIENGSSAPVEGVDVTVDNETLTTGEDGVVNVTFTENRSYSLTFTKNLTNATRYLPVTWNHTVTREELTLSYNQTEPIRPGQTLVYDLDDTDSHSVANASITVGNVTLITDENGQANHTFAYDQQGVHNLTASKGHYETVRRNLTVDAAGEELTLVTNRTSTVPGGTVRVNATTAGTPLANATVTVDNRTHRTNASGQVDVPFEDPGNYTVNVTRDGYEYRTVDVTVRRPLLNVSVDGPVSTANDTTATATLTLVGVPDGVTGYAVVLDLPDDRTAVFDTNATSYSAVFDVTENVSVSEHGTRVVLEAADRNESAQLDGSVRLATIGLDGRGSGIVTVSIVERRVDAENRSVDVRTSDAQFVVEDSRAANTTRDGGGSGAETRSGDSPEDETETHSGTSSEARERDQGGDAAGTTSTDAPGFGVLAALVALLGTVALLRRNQ